MNDGFRRILAPLASLRLTVWLLALSMFLVFAGTWAQIDRGIWAVMDLYFRTWWAWIPVGIFFPPRVGPARPDPGSRAGGRSGSS